MKKLSKIVLILFISIFFFHDVARAADSCQKTFTDLNDATTELQNAVKCMNLDNYCVIRGFPDNTFRRDDYLTRAEFVSFIIRYHYQVLHEEDWKIPDDIPDSEITFSDVPKTHGNYKEVYTSKRLGFVRGYEDGTFRPQDLWLYGFHGIWRNDNPSIKAAHTDDCFEGCYDMTKEGSPITRGEFIDSIYRYGQERKQLTSCAQTITQCSQCSRINGCEQTTFSSSDNCTTASGEVIRVTDMSCSRLNNPNGTDARCDGGIPPVIPHCPVVLPTDSGIATYKITVPTENDYVLWASVRPVTDGKNRMYVQADLECAQQMGGTITGEPLTWIKAPQSATSPTGSFHLTAGEHTIRFVGYDRGLNFYKFFLTNDLTCSMSSYADKTCDYPGKAAVFGLTQITPTVTILPTMPLSTITPPSKTSPLEKQSSVTPLPTSTNSSKSRLQFQIAPTVVKTP